MMTKQEAVTKWPFAASKPKDVRSATRMEATIAAHMMQARQRDERAGAIGKLPVGKKLNTEERGYANRLAVLNAMDDGPNMASAIAKKLGMDVSTVNNIFAAMLAREMVRCVTVQGTRWKYWHKVG
jgi:hypothetical protein